MQQTTQNQSQGELTWPVTVRFATVLVGCMLLSLSGGQSLSGNVAGFCYLCGVSGLTLYFCVEAAANRRSQGQAHAAQHDSEQRLSRRLQAEANVTAPQRPIETPDDAKRGVESAIDSQADLAVYLGPTTQPTLSV